MRFSLKFSLLVSLYNQQNSQCAYCLRKCSVPKRRDPRNKPDSPTIEHRVPKSRGGSNGSDNLLMACYACNCVRSSYGDDAYFGPTRDDMPTNFGQHNAMILHMWLDSIERLLEKVGRSKCPRVMAARIRKVKWAWSNELSDANLEYWVKVAIKEMGETIVNSAYVKCWSPKLHMAQPKCQK